MKEWELFFFQKLTSFTDGGADQIDGVAWRRLAVARLAGEKKVFFFFIRGNCILFLAISHLTVQLTVDYNEDSYNFGR